MNYKRCLLFTLLAIAFTHDIAYGYGSLAEFPTIEAMIERSDAIVMGTITRHVSRGELHSPYSDWTLEVEGCLKGSFNASEIVISTSNGVSSEPEANFSIGERVLVFLSRRGNYYEVVFDAFGKYLMIEGAPYPLNRVMEILNVTARDVMVDSQVEPSTDTPVQQVSQITNGPPTSVLIVSSVLVVVILVYAYFRRNLLGAFGVDDG